MDIDLFQTFAPFCNVVVYAYSFVTPPEGEGGGGNMHPCKESLLYAMTELKTIGNVMRRTRCNTRVAYLVNARIFDICAVSRM